MTAYLGAAESFEGSAVFRFNWFVHEEGHEYVMNSGQKELHCWQGYIYMDHKCSADCTCVVQAE